MYLYTSAYAITYCIACRQLFYGYGDCYTCAIIECQQSYADMLDIVNLLKFNVVVSAENDGHISDVCFAYTAHPSNARCEMRTHEMRAIIIILHVSDSIYDEQFSVKYVSPYLSDESVWKSKSIASEWL